MNTNPANNFVPLQGIDSLSRATGPFTCIPWTFLESCFLSLKDWFSYFTRCFTYPVQTRIGNEASLVLSTRNMDHTIFKQKIIVQMEEDSGRLISYELFVQDVKELKNKAHTILQNRHFISDRYISGLTFYGKNLLNFSGNTLIGEVCGIEADIPRINLSSVPRIPIDVWVSNALNQSSASKLQQKKPLATTHSGTGRTLAINWNNYSPEEKTIITQNLSNTLGFSFKIYASSEGTVFFYIEKYIKKLLILAQRTEKIEPFLEILSVEVEEPELLSLVYIMFGDLEQGLSYVSHEETELTEKGRKILSEYRRIL